MDSQMVISLIILLTLAEVFAVFLFVKYKQGYIEHNPFLTIFKKEWLLMFYAIFRWKRKREHNNELQAYSYHKGSVYFGLFIALLHEQVLEGIVFHIYLKEVDPFRAKILLVLHIFSVLYMLGDFNLVRNSPILIKNNKVTMNIGVRRSLSFHIKDVATIRPAKIQFRKDGGMIHEKNVFHVTALPRILTRIFGMSDDLKYEIVFNEPISSLGYFGQKKEVKKALIYMENPEPFIQELKMKIELYDEEEKQEERNIEASSKEKKPTLINWKIYFTLLFLNVLGALAISPYAMARENLHETIGLTKGLFTLLYVTQVLVEAGALLFIALWLAKKVNTKVPLIASIFTKGLLIQNVNKKVIQSALYGILTGILISIFSLLVSKPLGVDQSSVNEPSWWLGTLGSFGAAINEESIFRLFLVTVIIWLLMKISKSKVTTKKIWTAICLSALIFGLMHYSVAASNFDMSFGIIISMLVINGIGGVVFGALFVYMGLEFAIIAHFAADIVLHVLGPLVVKE